MAPNMKIAVFAGQRRYDGIDACEEYLKDATEDVVTVAQSLPMELALRILYVHSAMESDPDFNPFAIEEAISEWKRTEEELDQKKKELEKISLELAEKKADVEKIGAELLDTAAKLDRFKPAYHALKVSYEGLKRELEKTSPPPPNTALIKEFMAPTTRAVLGAYVQNVIKARTFQKICHVL